MMKKIGLIFLMVFLTGVSFAGDKNLHHMFKDAPEIRVYLAEVTSEVDSPYVKVSVFKDIFKDVLEARVDFKFIPVNSPDEADAIVKAHIEKYIFTEKVLPNMLSVWAAIADTTAPKSSAKITVDYVITKPQTGKTLHEASNFTTEERRPQADMNEENAFVYGAIKNINRFLYRTFRERERQLVKG